MDTLVIDGHDLGRTEERCPIRNELPMDLHGPEGMALVGGPDLLVPSDLGLATTRSLGGGDYSSFLVQLTTLELVRLRT